MSAPRILRRAVPLIAATVAAGLYAQWRRRQATPPPAALPPPPRIDIVDVVDDLLETAR